MQDCNGYFCKGKSWPLHRFPKKRLTKNGHLSKCKMCYYNENDDTFEPGKCIFCKNTHDSMYGSGRFCTGRCRSLYAKNRAGDFNDDVVIVEDSSEFKICSRINCILSGEEQPITNFYYRTRNTKSGKKMIRRSECKYCVKKGVVAYKATNIGYVKNLISSAKRRCRKKGWDFSLTEKDILELFSKQQEKCAISGMIMTNICGEDKHTAKHPFNASLDRIDSKKRYTKDNVQLVCNWIQSAKSDYDETNFKN